MIEVNINYSSQHLLKYIDMEVFNLHTFLPQTQEGENILKKFKESKAHITKIKFKNPNKYETIEASSQRKAYKYCVQKLSKHGFKWFIDPKITIIQ